MQNFEWLDFAPVDYQKLRQTREYYHHAVQYVSLVGRRFIPEGTQNRSSLIWVPGLFRLAGKWTEGEVNFRSSIGFQSFTLYLVDEKVITIASLDLNGKRHIQGMVWLEEQLAKLKLKATKLQMKLPYKLPDYPTINGARFDVPPDMGLELGKYFHNSYVSLRDIRREMKTEEPILVWPKDFDQVLTIVVKDSGDPDTTSRIALGMSPGDQYFDRPYFYVNTWPYADVDHCPKLSNGAKWFSDEWTGAVLIADLLLEAGDQKAILDQFYREAFQELAKLLTQ